MKLKQLIEPLDVVDLYGSEEVEVTGLCAHSQCVCPGNLFVAKRGKVHDGCQFIGQAISAGASAILTDRYDPLVPVAQLVCLDVACAEAQLAAHFFNEPSRQLKVVGITGTNGKTTASFLVSHMLNQLGMRMGLIGSVEWLIGSQRLPARATTPDVITCHRMLREMVAAGCTAAVMEVSSHSLSQGRVAEIAFDVAAFTNISPEHLDYHETMEAYKKDKASLFEGLNAQGVAVLNRDAPISFSTRARTITYGVVHQADLMAKGIVLSDQALAFTATYRGEQAEIRSNLIGRFNVENLLAALGIGIALGFSFHLCAKCLSGFKGVRGRLERVSNGCDKTVFVDYAHNPDALEKVLSTVRDFTKGKLIAVFGAGGDRDPHKRPLMGRVAASYADVSIITSDNPRTEDPRLIAEAIASGFGAQRPVIELDRRMAIAQALALCQGADAVVIAGKGHEVGQIVVRDVLPFDDVKTVQELCEGSRCT